MNSFVFLLFFTVAARPNDASSNKGAVLPRCLTWSSCLLIYRACLPLSSSSEPTTLASLPERYLSDETTSLLQRRRSTSLFSRTPRGSSQPTSTQELFSTTVRVLSCFPLFPLVQQMYRTLAHSPTSNAADSNIFTLITRMRQLACHPDLVIRSKTSSYIEDLDESELST